MEAFGILCSIPLAFVMSMVYCALCTYVLRQYEPLRGWFFATSLLVLLLFAWEVVLLGTLGAVEARALVGPFFYVGHLISFVLGTPALANVLLLRRKKPVFCPWFLAGVICTIFAFWLVLLQYSVSEDLYGIDGTGGPFS